VAKVVNIQPYVDKRDQLNRILRFGAAVVLYERDNGCAPRSGEEFAEWLQLIAPQHRPIDPYAVLTRAEIAVILSDYKHGLFGEMFRYPRETNGG
jgi:hypothetical protein